MKQAIFILSLGLLAACYNPRPIIMTVTKIQKKNESEQKEVWGQVGTRVLHAVLVDLPDSVKVGTRLQLLPYSRAPFRKTKKHTFTVVRK